jgi:5-formyltetrahydrofolate cyclo-ligase
MPRLDIRKYKKVLRAKYKNLRSIMSEEEKSKKDASILRHFVSRSEYKGASLVLTYVSKALEVDTLKLIERAWRDKKRVAVPSCIEKSRSMRFFEISSFDQLAKGTFGVLEPDEENCREVASFSGSVCVVPGLCFDSFGYRIGHGKGYYDRFLSAYSGLKIGLCYRNCIQHSIHHGRFDIPIDIVINEDYTKCVVHSAYSQLPKRLRE